VRTDKGRKSFFQVEKGKSSTEGGQPHLKKNEKPWGGEIRKIATVLERAFPGKSGGVVYGCAGGEKQTSRGGKLGARAKERGKELRVPNKGVYPRGPEKDPAKILWCGQGGPSTKRKDQITESLLKKGLSESLSPQDWVSWKTPKDLRPPGNPTPEGKTSTCYQET